ncbi:MAG: penicillin-binding protein 1C [Spirochaetes bacterium]|nr:penicillin-binding protein 1C [Spirochaetota bacterium]
MKIFPQRKVLMRSPWAVVWSSIVALFAFFLIIPPQDIFSKSSSCTLISEEGTVLHVFRDRTVGALHEWVEIDKLPADVLKILCAVEDKWFYWHPGVNPFAMIRAAWQNISSGKIVSGASTITQQLVRIVYGDRLPRNRFARKLVEIILAIKLEIHYSKREILEAYVNLVAFPGNCIGISMASRMMFNRDPRQLTVEESCALAVFIRRTAMSEDAFVRRFERLLLKISEKEHANVNRARVRVREIAASIFTNIHRRQLKGTNPIAENQFNPGSVAPHFVAYFRENFPTAKGTIVTTLSANLNCTVNEILRNEIASVKKFGGNNGAVLVLEIPPDGSALLLRAMVGSVDYFDENEGQVNGTIAIRQAGSTLKPFIYALAIDLFNYRPWTQVPDMPFAFETGVEGVVFQPQNYDMRFWGNIPIRDALASSRNIPAVWLVRKIGEEKFYAFLENAGFTHLRKGPHHHGLGMALGSAGASLMQLVKAYSAFPLKGEMRPLCIAKQADGNKLLLDSPRTLFSKKAAYYITHILADREARRRAFGKRNFQDFPFEVATKTGTSSDYRDAWIVGYTDKYVVGVWVGNFSGNKMYGVSGGWGAGRIFHQVMRVLEGKRMPRFHYPANWRMERICRITGNRVGKCCPTSVEIVSEDDGFQSSCHSCSSAFAIANYLQKDGPPQIISPAEGEVFFIDPQLDLRVQMIPLIIECPRHSFSLWSFQVNGGKKEFLHSSVRRPLSLAEGSHCVQLFENDVLKQKICFKIVK